MLRDHGLNGKILSIMLLAQNTEIPREEVKTIKCTLGVQTSLNLGYLFISSLDNVRVVCHMVYVKLMMEGKNINCTSQGKVFSCTVNKTVKSNSKGRFWVPTMVEQPFRTNIPSKR